MFENVSKGKAFPIVNILHMYSVLYKRTEMVPRKLHVIYPCELLV